MKKCCHCQESKALSEFGSLHSSKDGFSKRCKVCSRAAIAATKAKNGRGAVDQVKAKQRSKRFYERNPDYGKRQFAKHRDKINERSKAYQAKHRDALYAKRNADYQAIASAKKAAFVGPRIPSVVKRDRKRDIWKKLNPDKVNANTARRRAKKFSATPAWANGFFIREAYHLAKLRSAATGFEWQVDHIIPLRSNKVCGLHVEGNLQVIPAVLNRAKGNRLLEVVHHG